jgi:5-methylthioadenosine/S-adenosylhomocysteine deaminase
MIGDDTQTALKKSMDLLDSYHGKADGRLRYALTPRGVRNATDELWKEVVRLAKEHNVLIHTHAAENRQQSERLATLGSREVEYLAKWAPWGVTWSSPTLWLSPKEHDLLAKAGANVAHCPRLPQAGLGLCTGA